MFVLVLKLGGPKPIRYRYKDQQLSVGTQCDNFLSTSNVAHHRHRGATRTLHDAAKSKDSIIHSQANKVVDNESFLLEGSTDKDISNVGRRRCIRSQSGLDAAVYAVESRAIPKLLLGITTPGCIERTDCIQGRCKLLCSAHEIHLFHSYKSRGNC